MAKLGSYYECKISDSHTEYIKVINVVSENVVEYVGYSLIRSEEATTILLSDCVCDMILNECKYNNEITKKEFDSILLDAVNRLKSKFHDESFK